MSDFERRAWAAFWAKQGHGAGGCLPQGVAAIQAMQARVWRDFAARLPQRAKVLDLATGDGAVLKLLRAERSELKLTGADAAAALPPAPAGMAFKAGAPVEQLPFQDGAFDAVTSQFGYEYGDTSQAAGEVARVLRPGGKIQFVLHHQGSQIVKHNIARREALQWALAGGARLAEARQLARARANLPIPTPPAFREGVAEAAARFPGQPVAREFTLAALQCLELGSRASPDWTLGALADLEEKARFEIARIDALERAVCDRQRVIEMSAELDACGIAVGPATELFEANSQMPFAWLLSGDAGPTRREGR